MLRTITILSLMAISLTALAHPKIDESHLYQIINTYFNLREAVFIAQDEDVGNSWENIARHLRLLPPADAERVAALTDKVGTMEKSPEKSEFMGMVKIAVSNYQNAKALEDAVSLYYDACARTFEMIQQFAKWKADTPEYVFLSEKRIVPDPSDAMADSDIGVRGFQRGTNRIREAFAKAYPDQSHLVIGVPERIACEAALKEKKANDFWKLIDSLSKHSGSSLGPP